MIENYVALNDLFSAGLGADLAGAYLLARGVIASPGQLMQAHGFIGSQKHLMPSLARARIDGITGIAGLAAGFILQAVGYFALTAGASSETGIARVVVAVTLAIVTGAVVLIFAAYRRRGAAVASTLVAIASHDFEGKRQENPRGEHLLGWAPSLGPRDSRDDDIAYLRRVFGIRDAFVARTGGGFDRLSQRGNVKDEP